MLPMGRATSPPMRQFWPMWRACLHRRQPRGVLRVAAQPAASGRQPSASCLACLRQPCCRPARGR